MKGFERELMRRSPLAAAVLELTDFMFEEPWLQSTYEAHRGRCYEDKLQFGQFLGLMRDALVRHGGSAHQLFLELEADESEPVNESSFYRKLGNMPPPLSRALLRDEGILLIGSGDVMRNLHTYAWGRHPAQPFDWALRFEMLARELMLQGDHPSLVDYESLGADAALSV